jgi:hypothetical protein
MIFLLYEKLEYNKKSEIVWYVKWIEAFSKEARPHPIQPAERANKKWHFFFFFTAPSLLCIYNMRAMKSAAAAPCKTGNGISYLRKMIYV